MSFQFATQLFQIGKSYASVPAHDWPSCPDRQDWYLLDLLMASGADALNSKGRHLLRLRGALGLPVFKPGMLVNLGLVAASDEQ